ncbi:MAG: hypothetical protein OCD01_05460 [Fibrobacterales bacterium]
MKSMQLFCSICIVTASLISCINSDNSDEDTGFQSSSATDNSSNGGESSFESVSSIDGVSGKEIDASSYDGVSSGDDSSMEMGSFSSQEALSSEFYSSVMGVSSELLIVSIADSTYLDVTMLKEAGSGYEYDDAYDAISIFSNEADIREALSDDSYVLPEGKQVIRLYWSGSNGNYSGGFYMPMMVNNSVQLGVYSREGGGCMASSVMVGEIIIFEVDTWEIPTSVIDEHIRHEYVDGECDF